MGKRFNATPAYGSTGRIDTLKHSALISVAFLFFLANSTDYALFQAAYEAYWQNH
jgi:hypothetical protein